jgi:uncharacterized protein (TIGR02594 family)
MMQSSVIQSGMNIDVVELQKHLNKRLHPSPKLVTDGKIGPKTRAAIGLFQTAYGLEIDYVVGPKTWKALTTGLATNLDKKPIRVVSSTPLVAAPTSDAPWMDFARKQVGEAEIAGAIHNPRIIEYHATTSLRATADETAWCSSFVNWALKQAAIKGTDSAAAASWLKWGQEITPRPGAIIVIYNKKAANSSLTVSGNHVGFLVQDRAKSYLILGGNQSNQVKISSYPKAAWALKGCRWPSTNSKQSVAASSR